MFAKKTRGRRDGLPVASDHLKWAATNVHRTDEASIRADKAHFPRFANLHGNGIGRRISASVNGEIVRLLAILGNLGIESSPTPLLMKPGSE